MSPSIIAALAGILGGRSIPSLGSMLSGTFGGIPLGKILGTGNWQMGWDGKYHNLPPGAMSFAGGGTPGIPQGAMFAPVEDPLQSRYSMLAALARR